MLCYSFFFGVALGCCFILCSVICCISSQDRNHSLLTISTCVLHNYLGMVQQVVMLTVRDAQSSGLGLRSHTGLELIIETKGGYLTRGHLSIEVT